ncbi:MAG: UDP-N-acetylmuramoyl-tripeptide--D-alanyl-D-alanine ligase [Gammaproteobacteria bacterium]|nr:UDP-N-acetylmuramoyl-tripeptide--D-alanyl-D-alanine ligase [Gammaproteobacteria bacterium]
MSGADFRWNLQAIAKAAQGELIGEDKVVTGISTDTRQVMQGQVFIALAGERFDAHAFAGQACKQGAVAVVVNRPVDVDCAQIRVDDTRLALGRIARAWRQQFTLPLIAVTGSNGKTTVKEMLSAIMAVRHSNLSTQGNLNNDIGVPLTLLRLRDTHTSAVIEMGANHAKEIAYLTGLALPSVAIVNNAGAAHLEGFGSLEGVAHAKGEIYSGLGDDGVAIINADDRFAPLWREMCAGKQQLSFGLDNPADVSASWRASDNGSQIDLHTPQGDVQVMLPLPGRHNVMNALAASAGALAAGASLAEIRDGLQSMHSVAGRLQIKIGKAGSRIIDDTYNANPASLRVALDVLKNFDGRHFLALGDMGELGDNAEQLHREAGQVAKASGVDRLYTVGKLARFAASSFGRDALSYDDQPSMISALADDLNMDVTLLVKGSRLAHMENVVQALTHKGENG